MNVGAARDRTCDELGDGLLRAQVKASLLGGSPEPVRLGQFEIVRCLGRGGHGAVYEACDGAGARVALKLVSGARSGQGAEVQREFRALQRVAHPNLVVLHELFHVDERWFFTMELVSGTDFVRHVRAQDCPASLRQQVEQLLAGLVALHAARKVHRDLKPSNVLVNHAGRVVILDYGLLVDQDALDDSLSARAGTPSYMAPEQQAGVQVGAPADLYAVGRMLSEALQYVREPELEALCVELLASDPTERPSATSALASLRGVDRGTARAAHPRQPPTAEPFIGRQRELSLLARALERTRAGVACAAWVHGPSGIGKSSLLREFASEARRRGALVLEGRCYERENAPFKVFDGVAASLVRELKDPLSEFDQHALPHAALARLFPELARLPGWQCGEADASDPREQQKQAFAALRALLARLSETRPVLLMVDDLQWGDADSARLFSELLTPPNAPALLWVGAFRSDELLTSPFLRPLFEPRDPPIVRCEMVDVPVPNLTEAEVCDLVAALPDGTRSRAPALVAASIRDARGVPFLLHELLAAAASERVASDAAPRLDQLVSERASACSRGAQALLEVLCLADQPLRLSLAARAAHLPADGWSGAHELCTQRLARWRDTDGERCIEPYHDIVRALIARAVAPAEMRRAHLQLAHAYQALAADQLEQQLFHWLGAGETAQARGFAIAAAEQAERSFAWIRAAELYRTAHALVASERERQPLAEGLARVLSNAGDHGAAAEAYRAAAASAPASRALELRRLGATQLLFAGRSDEGAQRMRELLCDVGVDYPRDRAAAQRMFASARMRVPFARTLRRWRGPPPASAAREARHHLLRSAGATLFLTDPLAAIALHSLYLAEVRGTGSLHELHALAWEVGQRAVCFGRAGEPSIRKLLTELNAIVDAQATAHDRAIALLAESAYLIHCRERPADGLTALEQADMLLAASPGTMFERGCVAAARIDTLSVLGDPRFVGEAQRREREYLGRADGYSVQQLEQVIPMLRLMEDRPELSLAFLDAHWPDRGCVEDLFDYFALGRRCEALLYRGDARAAYDVLRRHWPALMRHPARPTFVAERAYLRARNAAALYAESGERAHRSEALRFSTASRRTPRASVGLMHTVRASVAASELRMRDALLLLDAAVAEFELAQQRQLAWLARYRLAQLAGDQRALSSAEAWLRAFGVLAPERWVQVAIPWKRC